MVRVRSTFFETLPITTPSTARTPAILAIVLLLSVGFRSSASATSYQPESLMTFITRTRTLAAFGPVILPTATCFLAPVPPFDPNATPNVTGLASAVGAASAIVTARQKTGATRGIAGAAEARPDPSGL